MLLTAYLEMLRWSIAKLLVAWLYHFWFIAMYGLIYLKDDEPIQPDDHHYITEYHRDVCRLLIKTITLDDEAYYKCEARNIHGVASTVIELFVQSKHIGLRRNRLDRLLDCHVHHAVQKLNQFSARCKVNGSISAECSVRALL